MRRPRWHRWRHEGKAKLKNDKKHREGILIVMIRGYPKPPGFRGMYVCRCGRRDGPDCCPFASLAGLKMLRRRGLVRDGKDGWVLTERGVLEATLVWNRRFRKEKKPELLREVPGRKETRV